MRIPFVRYFVVSDYEPGRSLRRGHAVVWAGPFSISFGFWFGKLAAYAVGFVALVAVWIAFDLLFG